MKLRTSMKFVTPVLLIFLVLCFLVVDFVVQNNQNVTLSYQVPFTSIHFPAEGTNEIHVVSLILISILIGIAIMMIFVAIAGIGWRWYALTTNSQIRKERRKLWDERERAIALSLMGFHPDAIDQFEHIIDKDNPHIELHVGLAEAYEREGDYQRAIENYNAILTRYPQNMRALFGAAKNWEDLGNYNDALKLYRRVLDVDRSSPAARQKVKDLLEKAGRYTEAIEEYQRTRQDSQEARDIIASLFYRLAVEQIKANDLKAAEKTLKESRRENDFYVPNMLILSNLYLKTGRERDAERLLEMTAGHTLSTVIFKRLEDYYYSQEGELAEKIEPVVELYKDALERDPNANHLRLALGKLYMKLEKYTEAEQLFMDFQREDASIPQVHLLLADLYQRTGNIDKALEEYRISAELVDIKIADFKCYHCGAMYEYWADQCSSCKSWGTIEDIFFKRGPQAVLPELKQKQVPQLTTSAKELEEENA